MSERIIFHVDVNSAFLSWEACHRLMDQKETTDIRLIPSAISGDPKTRHGIILAKSIAAGKTGIKTGEPVVKALQKCPELQLFPPDFTIYYEYSQSLFALLSRYAPVVEPFSIDEAFLDMTGTKTLYGEPVAFARKLSKQIKQELGFTVNIGVSTNKLLAKMASDFEKPDKVHTLFPDEIPQKMWPLPASSLLYVGRSSIRKLHNLGIFTIGELASSDPEILRTHLKGSALSVWQHANGLDDSPVIAAAPANKGYGNSLTLPFDLEDKESAKSVLLSLCETVGIRIRADHSYVGVVAVSVVDSDFNRSSRQMTLQNVTNMTSRLYESACSLFDDLWNGAPIRQLGVHTSKAVEDCCTQYSLFDDQKNEKQMRLDSAMDRIRQKYGEDSVKRGSTLSKPW